MKVQVSFGNKQGSAMGMSVGENKGGAMAEMNVVPLIDILLVLLIIFMVITPLTPKGLETVLPRPNAVQVGEHGKLKINNENTDFDRLGLVWNRFSKPALRK
jgi:biopolymer transport protein ExbD